MSTTSFIENVIKDRHGRKITQHVIHEIWQEHIDWCIQNRKNAGILAPWGHGKTEQIVIGRTLDFLGIDNNLRIKIICNTDPSATARVTSIKSYIEVDDDYHRFYPNVKPAERPKPKHQSKLLKGIFPGQKEKWAEHKFNVQRDGKGKDASVEAWGILSSNVGGRADVLIFDDPVDFRNAIAEPALREKVKQSYRNAWMSRLEDDGVVIYVATVWHESDLTMELVENEGYAFCIMRVSDDLETIEVSFKNINDSHPCWNGGAPYKIDLWEKFNKEELKRKEQDLGPTAFNRGFRNIPWSDDALMFRSFAECIDPDLSVKDFVKEAKRLRDTENRVIHFITGVDLSGSKRPGNVVFTAGIIEGNNQIIPVDIRMGAWTSPQTADVIKEVYRMWRPLVIYVENVALQNMIIEWMQLEAVQHRAEHMPIEGFMTGLNKAHPENGLPGMEVEFRNHMWKIPGKEFMGHEYSCVCPWCSWIKSMKGYPFSGETDTVMASWFMREGMRKYCGMGSLMMTSQDYKDLSNDSTGIAGFDLEDVDNYMSSLYLAPAGGERSSFSW